MYVDKNGKCDGTRLIAGDTACSEPEMCQPQQRDKPAGIEELPVVLFTKLERDSERERERDGQAKRINRYPERSSNRRWHQRNIS